MKRIAMFSFAALAAFAVACAEIENPQEPGNQDPTEQPENPDDKPQEPQEPETPADGNTIVFTANLASRTSIDSEDKVASWVAGDQVKFVWAGGEAVATAASAGQTTTFTIEKLAEGIDEVYAVYPAAANVALGENGISLVLSNSLEDGSFGAADYCVAKSVKVDGNWQTTLAFKNAATLFKVGITNPNVTRVQIETVGQETIAGTLPLSFSDEGELVVGTLSGDRYTVNMAVNGAGIYYIPVLPGVAMEQGFRVNSFAGDEQLTPFYYHGSFTTQRGQIVKLEDLSNRAGHYYVTPDGAGAESGQNFDNAINTETFKAFVTNQDNYFLLRGATFHFSADEFSFGDDYLAPDFSDHSTVNFTLEGTVSGDNMTVFKGRENTGESNKAGVLWPKANTDLTVKNVKFTGTNGTSNSAAIRVNTSSAKLTLDGCKFIDNKTAGNGACVNVYKSVPVVIKNCLFQDNYGWGAALFIDKTCPDINVTIEDTQMIENTGNPIWSQSANEVTLERVLFKDNVTTSGDGGSAVAIEGSGVFTFTDTEFIGNICDLGANIQKGGVVMILTDDAEARFNRCLFDGNVTNRSESKNEASAAVVNSRNASTFYFNACEFKENSSGTGNSPGIYGGLKGTVIATYRAATIAMNNCYVHDNYGGRNTDDIAWIYIDNPSAKFIMSNTTVIGDQTRYDYTSPKNKKGVIRLQQDCYSYVYNSIICSKYEDGKSIGCGVSMEINSLYNKTSPGLDSDTVWKTDTGSGHDYYASTTCFGGLNGYMWNGQMTGTNSTVLAPTADINSALQDADADFYAWLESIGALGKDINGNSRGATSWPGCYQAN